MSAEDHPAVLFPLPQGIRISTGIAGLEGEAGSGLYIVVSVAYTGTGMPPEVLARAMEPFFTTKDIGQGTGLGLSQVYVIARQSGGDVRIKSFPGGRHDSTPSASRSTKGGTVG